ncbi:MAG: hypothetical protein K6E94_02960 [Elusimicrobiaceae bacterium]|nr:hypothetical protein [Elusimicrobiaceae bacterium]
MKFKNLFDIKNIKRFVILAIILFFVLPVIVPQKKSIKIIKKEISLDREESPLPIFSKETPLEKYIKRVKKFYGFAKEPLQEQAEDEPENQEEVYAEDLFFSYEDDDEINHTLFANANPNAEMADTSVNLQKGTVMTASDMLLEPTQEGYYYKGQFYKNGTYPPNANKQEIEVALNNYHSAIAKYHGKKALYVADSKGNLTVDYINEYPDNMSDNIDKYFAQNPLMQQETPSAPTQNKVNSNKTKYYNNQRYAGAHINGNGGSFQNTNVNMSDVALASLYDMHSAYNLANAKIKSGELGQNIDIEQPGNQNQNNSAFDNSLNNLAISEPEIDPENPNLCQGNECNDALIIAPKLEGNSSDLNEFYNSFCENGEDCPFTDALKENNSLLQTNLNNEQDMQDLAKKLSESEQKKLELAYIHPDKKYNALIEKLQQMELKNKNGDPIDIRLRNFETVDIDDENSFGDKILASRKNSMKKDLSSNPVLINELVEQYNYVHENVDKLIDENDQTKISMDILNLTEKPNYPVALVEKDKDGSFIINSPYLPGGYGSTEIKAWKKYAVKTETGTHYKIPKTELMKAPKDLVVILVNEDKKRDINLPNEHPVSVMTKEELQNLKFDNVTSNLFSIYDAQVKLAEYNAYKENKIPRPLWMGKEKQKAKPNTPTKKK